MKYFLFVVVFTGSIFTPLFLFSAQTPSVISEMKIINYTPSFYGHKEENKVNFKVTAISELGVLDCQNMSSGNTRAFSLRADQLAYVYSDIFYGKYTTLSYAWYQATISMDGGRSVEYRCAFGINIEDKPVMLKQMAIAVGPLLLAVHMPKQGPVVLRLKSIGQCPPDCKEPLHPKLAAYLRDNTIVDSDGYGYYVDLNEMLKCLQTNQSVAFFQGNLNGSDSLTFEMHNIGQWQVIIKGTLYEKEQKEAQERRAWWGKRIGFSVLLVSVFCLAVKKNMLPSCVTSWLLKVLPNHFFV